MRAYLELFRAPNVFTAMADVGMGFLFVQATVRPVSEAPLDVLVCLLAASGLLYTAGMVLNDVYDVRVDARERPQRPLPSGRISLPRATALGYGMLLAGAALAAGAGYLRPGDTLFAWRPAAVGTVLAACVVLYDAVLKRTVLGPLAMGSCRLLNVLLGMSVAPSLPLIQRAESWQLVGYDAGQLVVAAGIGLYIVGVTWFARTEARHSSRVHLALAVSVMLAGIYLLSVFPRFDGYAQRLRFEHHLVWPLLLLLLAVTIVRRTLTAVLEPTPTHVQAAVKICILSLIMLDAAVALSVAGPWAVGIVALLIPSLVLGWWVYST